MRIANGPGPWHCFPLIGNCPTSPLALAYRALYLVAASGGFCRLLGSSRLPCGGVCTAQRDGAASASAVGVMLGPGSDPYVLNPRAHQSLLEMMQELTIRNEEDPWRVDRIQF